MSAIVGIDLGTTNSAVGVMVDGKPVLISSSVGSNLTESVVGVDESGEILVGSAAKEHQVLNPDQCASCFKRQMGTDWSVQVGKHRFSAVQLSSFILKSLKACLLYTSPSPRDQRGSRMPSSA